MTIVNGKPTKAEYPTDTPPTYAAFYQTLADALAGKGKPAASAEEARDVIRIIELARESSKVGKVLDF